MIGASDDYINRMKVPYQATSYIAANTKAYDDSYIYKIPGKNAGGVLLLSGGKRKSGDNAFASTNRILIGYKAIMMSAVNLMVNKNQIWNWEFFGNNFKESNPEIYEDLLKLELINKRTKHFSYIVNLAMYISINYGKCPIWLPTPCMHATSSFYVIILQQTIHMLNY